MTELTDPQDALEEISHSTEIGPVWAALMVEFGGPDGLAHTIKMVFDAAPKGGPTQARIAVALLSGLQRHEANDDPDEDPESCEAREQQLLEVAKQQLQGVMP